MLESRIQASSIARLRRAGWLVWPTGPANGQILDFHALSPHGVPWYVEVKQPGKSPTREQLITAQRIRNNRGRTLVLRRLSELSVMLDDDTLARITTEGSSHA